MLIIKIYSLFIVILFAINIYTIDSQIIKTINPDEGKILSLAFSNNGDNLAIGTTTGVFSKKCLFIYDTDEWKRKIEIGDLGWRDVLYVKFSPDDNYIASAHLTGGNGYRTASIWDTYGNLVTDCVYGDNVLGFDFTGDSKYIVFNKLVSKAVYWGKNFEWTGTSNVVYFNILSKETKEYKLKEYKKEGQHGQKDPKNYISNIYCNIQFSYPYILAEGYYDELLLWNIKENSNNASTLITKNELTHVKISLSPDGLYAAVANYSKENWIYLWDLKSKLHIGSFKGHNDWVTSLSFSPDGKYLISGSEDETIRIWDVKTKKSLKALKDHQDNVNSVVFSKDGKYMATGGDDGRIFIWDANELMPDLKIFSANYDLKYGLTKEFEEEKQKEIALLNEMFNPKGEFETTEEYNSRISKASEDKKAIEEKYKQKLQEYIVSKQSELDKLNEEKKETDNEKQKELESKIESSIKDTVVNIASIGTYDADKNILPVTVKGKSGKIYILRSEAQSLKENWKKTKAKAKMKLRDDLKTYEYFDIIIIHPLTNNEFKLEY